MDGDASICGEVLFTFITEKASKYFPNGDSNIMNQLWASNAKDEFKDELNANIYLPNGGLKEFCKYI